MLLLACLQVEHHQIRWLPIPGLPHKPSHPEVTHTPPLLSSAVKSFHVFPFRALCPRPVVYVLFFPISPAPRQATFALHVWQIFASTHIIYLVIYFLVVTMVILQG